MHNLTRPVAANFRPRMLDRLFALLAAGTVVFATTGSCFATDFVVSNASEISDAMNAAQPGDVLIMTDGVWSDQQIDFAGTGTASAPITLRAETLGEVTLNNGSTLSISGRHLVVNGLNFENGGNNSLNYVIQFRGSEGDARDCRLTNTQVLNYNPSDSSQRYHWVNLYGQDNQVDHCRMQGQNHSGVTLVVVLNDNGQAARHLIDSNAFLDRPVGAGNGFEGIRIGTSSRAATSAQCIVQNNLFDRMDGEIEIISNKAGDNIYRYNTFRDSAGTLTLRHGRAARVEGNFFLGEGRDRSGGIRVVDSDHVIINNYIADIDDRADAAISLAAGIVNTPANGYQIVRNIQIHNNTIVDVNGAAVIYDWGFGDTDNRGVQNQIASNVSFTNNLIRSSATALFEGQEGSNWTYDNNIAFGASLGIGGRAGLMTIDPQISLDSTGLWRPDLGSPAIDEGAVVTISDDMDGQARLGAIDIGADEFSLGDILRTPLTRDDVGPDWNPTEPTEPTEPTDPTGTLVINDSFTNGFSDLSGNGMELDFFTTSSSSGLSSDRSDPGPIDYASGTSGRSIHGLFAPQTLAAAGDRLEVTIDFTTPASIGTNNEDFRFGLFSTARSTNGQADYATNIAASTSSPNPLLEILAGFEGEVDNINAAGTDLGLRTHNVNALVPSNASTSSSSSDGSPSGILMNTTGGFDLISVGEPDEISMTGNTSYTARLLVELNDPTLETLDVTVELLGAGGSVISTHTDALFVEDQADGEIGVNTFSFDLLGISATSGAFGSSNRVGDADNGIDISNVTITKSSADTSVVLGDANCDGIVNFLDIAPFIGFLSSGEFKAQADVNGSGTVDFLDIAPFIAILSGQ